MKKHIYVGLAVALLVGVGAALWVVSTFGVVSAQTVTETNAQEFADYVCDNVQPWFHEPVTDDGSVMFRWETDPYQSPMEGPQYQDYTLTFRLERLNLYGKNQRWIHVADTPDYEFRDTHSRRGEWEYRVGLLSVTLAQHTVECYGEPYWNHTWVFVNPVPSDEQLREAAQKICGATRIGYLLGYGDWNETSLEWDVELQGDLDLPWLDPGLDDIPFGELLYLDESMIRVAFRVDRLRDGVWRTVDNLADDFQWYEEAIPGIVRYRVALTSLEMYGKPFSCSAPLHFREVEVDTPTHADRQRIDEDRDILIQEAVRCTRAAFMKNISPEAAPVVNRYVDTLIEDMIPDYGGYYDLEEVVGYVLIMCSFSSEDGMGANPWALMMFLEGIW